MATYRKIGLLGQSLGRSDSPADCFDLNAVASTRGRPSPRSPRFWARVELRSRVTGPVKAIPWEGPEVWEAATSEPDLSMELPYAAPTTVDDTIRRILTEAGFTPDDNDRPAATAAGIASDPASVSTFYERPAHRDFPTILQDVFMPDGSWALVAYITLIVFVFALGVFTSPPVPNPWGDPWLLVGLVTLVAGGVVLWVGMRTRREVRTVGIRVSISTAPASPADPSRHGLKLVVAAAEFDARLGYLPPSRVQRRILQGVSGTDEADEVVARLRAALATKS